MPVVRRVYPAVRDLIEAFSPARRSGFREFVIIEHPRDGSYTYGFLTREVRVDGIKPDPMATVYVPTNHLYLGDIVLVPRAAVIPTGLSDRGRHPDHPVGRHRGPPAHPEADGGAGAADR